MSFGQSPIMRFRNSNSEEKNLKLSKLVALSIDCQATHSDPAKGHLIEIGWVNTEAAEPFDKEKVSQDTEIHLMKIKDITKIPKPFLKFTGIKQEEFKKAEPKKIVWQKLYSSVQKTAKRNKGIPFAVIHYRRYEEPYLRQLHHEFSSGQEFSFFLVCTHEIFRRLYPRHPRKSLRAVAGYLGHPLPISRRSLHHVTATAFIWQQVVKLLEENKGITRLNDLIDWLESAPSLPISRRCVREYPMEKRFRQELPDRPGIYRMYRSTGDLLYIGKAKSLKHRVNSYFHKHSRHAEHILEMLSQAKSLSYTITRTALEAAILESDEIKCCSPPYNRALRSQEREILFYTNELKSSQTQPDSKHRIGPLPSHVRPESLALLIDMINEKNTHVTSLLVNKILTTPPEYAPDTDCFKAGIIAYKQEFSDPINTPIDLSVLMRLGAGFWQAFLNDRESTAESEDEEGQGEEDADKSRSITNIPEEPVPIIWTPQRVVKAIKRIIRTGTFYIRRSRWYCRLSESTLVWAKADNGFWEKNVRIIENGILSYRADTPLSQERFIPPGHKKSLLKRQEYFDISTYDRMRVVTTEIRRIIQEGREVGLCFHPKSALNTEQLKKMLKWI